MWLEAVIISVVLVLALLWVARTTWLRFRPGAGCGTCRSCETPVARESLDLYQLSLDPSSEK